MEQEDEAGQLEDVSLVRRCQQGEMAAFNPLVAKYRHAVHAAIYHLVRNEEDARDLAQETFLKAWRNLAHFHGRSSFFTWLYRIAVNLAIDALRRKQRADGPEFNESLGPIGPDGIVPESATASAPEALPHRRLEARELQARIEAALSRLSADHRAVILLREVEGLPYEAIAQAMGSTVGTVMSRLFYARKKLQPLLRDLYESI